MDTQIVEVHLVYRSALTGLHSSQKNNESLNNINSRRKTSGCRGSIYKQGSNFTNLREIISWDRKMITGTLVFLCHCLSSANVPWQVLFHKTRDTNSREFNAIKTSHISDLLPDLQLLHWRLNVRFLKTWRENQTIEHHLVFCVEHFARFHSITFG